jgi:hypothetical protein
MQSPTAELTQSASATTSAPTTGSPETTRDSDEARRARRRVAAESRKRIANACLACKSRKQRCDGERPCNICKRRGAECIYVEQPARPTKRQRSNTNYASSPPGGHAQHSPGRIEHASDPWRSSFSAADVPGGSEHTRSHSASTGPFHAAPAIETTEPGVPAINRRDEDDERVEAPVDHRTRMLSDPSGRLRMSWQHLNIGTRLPLLTRQQCISARPVLCRFLPGFERSSRTIWEILLSQWTRHKTVLRIAAPLLPHDP